MATINLKEDITSFSTGNMFFSEQGIFTVISSQESLYLLGYGWGTWPSLSRSVYKPEQRETLGIYQFILPLNQYKHYVITSVWHSDILKDNHFYFVFFNGCLKITATDSIACDIKYEVTIFCRDNLSTIQPLQSKSFQWNIKTLSSMLCRQNVELLGHPQQH